MLSLHSRYDRAVIEQAAMAGDLTPLTDEAEAKRYADDISRRLDAISEETERGWTGEVREFGQSLEYVFKRTLRGVTSGRDARRFAPEFQRGAQAA